MKEKKTDYRTKNVLISLTTSNILKKTSEAEIYRHYLGFEYSVGTLFCSPLPHRAGKDSTPSFGIYARNNKLLWNDFGDPTSSGAGDVFKFVQIMHNMTFLEALADINNSMNLGIKHNASVKPSANRIIYPKYQQKILKKGAYIQRIVQRFNEADKKYWQQGSVKKTTLQHFNIFSTKKIYFNFVKIWEYTDNNPIYSWEIDGKIKGYRPLEKNKRKKWINNCSGNSIQGWEQLPEKGDILFITKSLKDVVVFYEMGIPAIAPQSENIVLKEEVIDGLYERFNNIIVMFDNDEAGIKAMIEYEFMHGIPYIYIPTERGAKDAFEFVSKYSLAELKRFIL